MRLPLRRLSTHHASVPLERGSSAQVDHRRLAATASGLLPVSFHLGRSREHVEVVVNVIVHFCVICSEAGIVCAGAQQLSISQNACDPTTLSQKLTSPKCCDLPTSLSITRPLDTYLCMQMQVSGSVHMIRQLAVNMQS